jgi:hypothetical protein
VPFIIMQQVQPAFIMADMQSQHDWIISQHLASPLVQVMTQPSLVISHLHMPIVRLQVQTTMPFIRQQTLHMPPASIWQRFCIMAQAEASSHEQVIFIPPWHFSIFMVQRGTIVMFAGIIEPIMGFAPGIAPGIGIFSATGFIIAIMGLAPCGPAGRAVEDFSRHPT